MQLRAVLVSFAVVTLSAHLLAATTQVQILIDADNNPATGCDVMTSGGVFHGVEQIVTTTYDASGTSPVVAGVTSQTCSGGTFGSASVIDSGGWPVGSSGFSLLETHLGSHPGPMHLGFTISSGSLSSSVLTQPGGDPIIFPPVLDAQGRHRVIFPSGPPITLDGNGNDWAGIPPLVAGSGDGTPALRFLQIFANQTGSDTFFRFDIQANASAPTANDDNYSLQHGGTLTVAAPGVLANDTDPASLPLTAILVSGPQHGTLTLNANGSFTYVNDGSAAPVDSFRYKANNGTSDSNTATVTLTIISGTAPVITSANHATFSVGTNTAFTVTATGNPTPAITESGALPGGVTFNSATHVLSGTPAAGSGGIYSITFTASNVAGTATQTFTLTVDEAVAITSANATSFTAGAVSSFTVTTSGFPHPTIGETGTLPAGITFTASGNGTATIGGTPGATSGGVYALVISASNGGPAVTQNFTLTINQAPAITSANSTTFTVGTGGTFTVTATGFPAPTLAESGALPGGVTFNAATGILSGTPAAGSGGTYSITFSASNVAGSVSQTFTLTVDEAPAIISANATTFTVGSAGTFTVTASGFPAPTIADGGSLPAGVTYNPATHVLSGTPAAGTGGTYPITFTPNNGIGAPFVQNFTLTVNQAPAITSANNTTFTVGTGGTFTVTASGFPAPTLGESGTLPGGVTFNAATGILSGTPAAGSGGTYSILFSATNGIGAPASQPFTLTVEEAPAITSANATTFAVGTAGSFTVTASGFPAPTIAEGGSLPTGVTYSAATHVLSGTPAAGTGGTYPITFTPSNGIGAPVAQNFTLTVNEAPAITSANNTTFAVGSGGTFTVTATGFPVPTLGESGTLPGGVSFNAATGVLSGTPNPGTGGSYPLTFSATSVAGSINQSFTLIVNQAAAITTANSTTFTVGSSGSFSIVATGFPAPTVATSSALPNGVTLAPNGLLSGTPAAGTGGSYSLTITATNGVGSPAMQSFTLTVDEAPAFTSANSTTFAVGTPGTFTVAATGYPAPTFSTTSSLPTGVTLTSAGVLSGTPNPGTGGVYAISITASNGVLPSANQNFTLTVNETLSFTSANSTTFTLGSPSTFTVQTLGFPKPTITNSGALPNGVTFTDNGDGTATLAGTPTAGGTFPLTFHATNGVSPNATQAFTLTVDHAPAITSLNSATFQLVTSGSFTVTTTGFPIPTITHGGVALPTGVTFVDNGNGTGTLSGTPAAGTGGSYSISFTASNGVLPNATQNFTLNVNQLPAITSASSYTAQAGTPLSFSVTANGFPIVTLSQTGLPTGATFTDNGNDTGTLSGSITSGGAQTYPVVLTAANGVGPNATQNFSLIITCPTITVTRSGGGTFPAAAIGSPYAGQSVTASGSSGTPYTFTVSGGTFPSGLSLAASGAIIGTPTATGTFTFTVTATDAYGCSGLQSFTIAVNPVATSDSYGTLVDNTQAAVVGGSTSSPATPFVALSGSILANDLPLGGVTLTPGTFVTSAGGSVTIAPDGTFLYTPKVNSGAPATTSDSFPYSISSNTGGTPTPTTAVGTVSLSLAGRVWYVMNNGLAGNGQSQSPFDTLSAAIAASTSNDTIFVYRGDGSTANLGTASTLKSGQSLIGEGAGLTVNAHVLVAAGLFPLIGNTVTLAANVTVNGIDMTTGSNTGISGGGVSGLNVTVRNLTSLTGTAVLLNGTGGTIAFTSVNANGAANGISLTNTTGSFSVNGNGGTCTIATPTCTGGTILGTTGAGINITSAQNVSLAYMNIHNCARDGISGVGAGGFSLSNSVVTSNGSISSGNTQDSGVNLRDTTGAVAFNTDAMNANHVSNVRLMTCDGTAYCGALSNAAITTLTVTNGSYDGAPTGPSFLMEMYGTSKISTGTFNGVTFANNSGGNAIDAIANDNSVIGDSSGVAPNGALTVSGCTFSNNVVGPSFEAGGGTGNSNMYVRFVSNSLQGTTSNAVNFDSGATSTGGTMKILATGNTIGTAVTTGSGSAIGEGIVVTQQGFMTMDATITNNTVTQIPNGRGIDVQALGSTTFSATATTANVLVTGNNVNPMATFSPPYAIYVDADDQGSPTLVNAEIHGNTVPMPAGGACDTSCSPTTSMLFYEVVTPLSTGTLYNFNGVGANVSSEIANTNSGTSGLMCSTNTGLNLTPTPVTPVP